MKTNSFKVHLVCTAHLDPVWLWSWEEGLREAISTFRTAVNMLDEFPEFEFNHNESLLYEWVKKYDPPLFKKIQLYVLRNRWHIAGGWYLQPDLNIPGGEIIIRNIAEGRRFFKQNFNKRPTVAYNFDSFGHPSSLPQILKQSGFKLYVHCRPTISQLQLPNPLYLWEGHNKSQIVTLRPDSGWYCTPGSGVAQESARKALVLAAERKQDILVLWGLGNHGGGPTHEDLCEFREIIKSNAGKQVELCHSSLEKYASTINKSNSHLPIHRGELQRTLAGTYTSIAPIKRLLRDTESLITSAERWSAISYWRYDSSYPAEELRSAWKNLIFNSFHDICCGSLIESALPGVIDKFGVARDIARKIIVENQLAVISNKKALLNTIPLYVLNPHSTALKGPIRCNILRDYRQTIEKTDFTLYDDQGKRVSHQENGGDSIILDESNWQPFVGFIAKIPPLTSRRYEIRFKNRIKDRKSSIITSKRNGLLYLKSKYWHATFDYRTSTLTKLSSTKLKTNILSKEVGLFSMKDFAHAWGGENIVHFNKKIKKFKGLTKSQVGIFSGMDGKSGNALRITAQGPAWITIECLVGIGFSRASIKYTFYEDLEYVDINLRLYMQERLKMIKLVLPLTLANPSLTAELPHGETNHICDGSEHPCLRWISVKSPNLTVGIANNGQSGYHVNENGEVGLSITRGAVHGSWIEAKGLDTNKSYTYMDQQQIDTRFRLLADQNPQKLAKDLRLAALELNQPIEHFFNYYSPTPHKKSVPYPKSFLTCDQSCIELVALKKADFKNGIIFRFLEKSGKAVDTQITLEGRVKFKIHFNPYELKTFYISKSNNKLIECNILEEFSPSCIK